MREWLSEYWYLILVFIAVLIVAMVIFYFAVRAYSKHASSFKAQEAEMRRLLGLKEKYFDFTENTIEENSDEEILEGVTLSYQLRLQKDENPEKAFSEMNEEKKNLYVLDVFCADGDVKIFFSENGDIVRGRIVSALEMVGMTDFSKEMHRVSQMYDTGNESVSYSEKELDRINDYISENNILTRIKLSGAEYIKNNYELIKN